MKTIALIILFLGSVAYGDSISDESYKQTFKGEIHSAIFDSGMLSLEIDNGCDDHVYELRWDYDFCRIENYLNKFDFYTCEIHLVILEGNSDLCEQETRTIVLPLSLEDAPQELRENQINNLPESYYLYFNSGDRPSNHFWIY